MKQFLLLLVVVALGLGAYCYFVDPSALEKYAPALAKMINQAPKDTVAAGIVAGETADEPPAAASQSAPLATPAASDPAPASAAPVRDASTPPPAASSSGAASSAASVPAAPAPEGPSTIKLKNGKTITGKVVITDPDITWIRTGDGKTEEVKTKDIVSGLPLRRR
jgi:hypothetical protein